MIFYQRNWDPDANKELFEIKDPVFLQKMQQDYKLKYSKDLKTGNDMLTPLIMGSIVSEQVLGHDECHNHLCNMSFNRRLRMMRADLHALLSISINSDFFENPKDSQVVKMAICKFLEGENLERAE